MHEEPSGEDDDEEEGEEDFDEEGEEFKYRSGDQQPSPSSLQTSTSPSVSTVQVRKFRRPPVGGKWTAEEDKKLRDIVLEHGAKNWKKVAELLGPVRSDVQCLHRWNKVLRPGLHKGTWTDEEDEIVRKMVLIFGTGKVKWSEISEKLPGRIGKQCRERWFNHLDPNIKRGDWSIDEDRILFESQKQFGNRWCEIMKILPGRTENSLKNHWNSSTFRRWLKDSNLQPGSGEPIHDLSTGNAEHALAAFAEALMVAGIVSFVDTSLLDISTSILANSSDSKLSSTSLSFDSGESINLKSDSDVITNSTEEENNSISIVISSEDSLKQSSLNSLLKPGAKANKKSVEKAPSVHDVSFDHGYARKLSPHHKKRAIEMKLESDKRKAFCLHDKPKRPTTSIMELDVQLDDDSPITKSYSTDSGYDVGDVGNALIESLSQGNIPLGIGDSMNLVYDDSIDSSSRPSFLTSFSPSSSSSKPKIMTSLPAHLRPPLINTSPREIVDCNDDRIIAMLHSLKSTPTPTRLSDGPSKSDPEERNSRDDEAAINFPKKRGRKRKTSVISSDRDQPYECEKLETSSPKSRTEKGVDGEDLESSGKNIYIIKDKTGPGRPKGSSKHKTQISLTLDTNVSDNDDDIEFDYEKQSPTSRALSLLFNALTQQRQQSICSNNGVKTLPAFPLAEDELVPLQMLPYFKYLNETAQRSLMRQLIERFQRTTFTPRNASLFTPRYPNAGGPLGLGFGVGINGPETPHFPNDVDPNCFDDDVSDIAVSSKAINPEHTLPSPKNHSRLNLSVADVPNIKKSPPFLPPATNNSDNIYEDSQNKYQTVMLSANNSLSDLQQYLDAKGEIEDVVERLQQGSSANKQQNLMNTANAAFKDNYFDFYDINMKSSPLSSSSFVDQGIPISSPFGHINDGNEIRPSFSREESAIEAAVMVALQVSTKAASAEDILKLLVFDDCQVQGPPTCSALNSMMNNNAKVVFSPHTSREGVTNARIE